MCKPFARKLVRLTSDVSKKDIEREAEVVTSLCKHGGHENIILTFGHDWLASSLVYYIDMELGDFTLTEYMRYLNGGTSSGIDFDTIQFSDSVFICKDCPWPERMRNTWTIGSHIARGLEFMHSREYVHRDLKPSNGTSIWPWRGY